MSRVVENCTFFCLYAMHLHKRESTQTVGVSALKQKIPAAHLHIENYQHCDNHFLIICAPKPLVLKFRELGG